MREGERVSCVATQFLRARHSTCCSQSRTFADDARPESSQLLKGPRGEALLLRGAAAREAAAAAPKRTIDVTYMDGVIEKTQTWTVEPDPEAINVDERMAWGVSLRMAAVLGALEACRGVQQGWRDRIQRRETAVNTVRAAVKYTVCFTVSRVLCHAPVPGRH